MTTITKIQELLEGGKLYLYENRCWFTCYMTYRKLNKKEKAEVVMVEGKANGNLHYWLEVDGEIVDVHYKILDDDLSVEDEYTYKPLNKIDLSTVKVDKEYYEQKPAYNWYGKEKWSKVWHLEL